MKLHRLPPMMFALPFLYLSGHAADADAADAPEAPWSVRAGVGPFGLGVGMGKQLTPNWVLRVDLLSGTFGGTETKDELEGIDYDIRGKAKPGISALADWFPKADSGFHVTGGLVYSRLHTDLHGRPDGNGNYSINGNVYSASQTGGLQGSIKSQGLMPYLGVGWQSAPSSRPGWRFVTDLGVVFVAKPDATLSAGNATAGSALQRDVDAERKDLEKASLGLAFSLGVAYAF